MRKSFAKPISRLAGGFTLLELLVVIAIIGILAGLMFPATVGALRRAEVTNAQNTAYQLRNSITAYFTEYRKYPIETGTSTEDVTLESDEQLMDVILGSESERGTKLNPRRIAFYSGKQAKPKGGGKYIKGITMDAQGGGKLWDPWGGHYFVMLDANYDNRTNKPSWDNTGNSEVLPETVLIWSAGKDEDENEASDNVKTW